MRAQFVVLLALLALLPLVYSQTTAAASTTTTCRSVAVEVDDDDGAPLFNVSDRRLWRESSLAGNFQGRGYRFCRRGKGNEAASFNVPLPSRGEYAVAIRYPAYANRATRVRVRVYHNGGIFRTRVNQQGGDGSFIQLGRFFFNETGVVQVMCSKSDWKIAVADAVRFIRICPVVPNVTVPATPTSTSAPAPVIPAASVCVPKTEVHDNDGTALSFQIPSRWATSKAIKGFLGDNYLFCSQETNVSHWAKYRIPLTLVGTYNVSLRWSAFSNRDKNVRVAVKSYAGEQIFSVDQTQAGAQFNLIGQFFFDRAAVIKILCAGRQAETVVIIDAVKLDRVCPDPGVTTQQQSDRTKWLQSRPTGVKAAHRFPLASVRHARHHEEEHAEHHSHRHHQHRRHHDHDEEY